MKKILLSLSLLFSILGVTAQPMCQIHYSGSFNNAPCGIPVTYTIASIGWPSGRQLASQGAVTACLAQYINDYLIVENGVLNNYDPATGSITITWNCHPCSYFGNASFSIADDFATNCGNYRILIEEALTVACTPQQPCSSYDCQYTSSSIRRSSPFVYPSPANDNLNISFPSDFSGETNITMYDLSGKVVMQKRLDNALLITVPTGNWHNGMYLIKASNMQGEFSQKVFIQH